MDKLYIPVIVGTTREQRVSYWAAKFLYDLGCKIDQVQTDLIDPKNFNFPGDGNDPEGKDPRFSDITSRAAGFLIVTPEYNHSIPGSLKRMLDSEYENYTHKAVAFAGASNGSWGGVRAIEALVLTTRAMGLICTYTDLHFPKVQDLFDANGSLIDQSYIPRAEKLWHDLIWLTTALKAAR